MSTNVKLFADDTSLFSVVHDIASSSCDLNHDLNKVREWAFQWKISFNPEPSKQGQEVIFTCRLHKMRTNKLSTILSIKKLNPFNITQL